MCGRYILTVPGEVLARLFDLDEVPELGPRYNIAPGQLAPVVRAADGARRLAMLRWGLVPHWARDPRTGNRPINARAESVASRPSFRDPFRYRRCLVPADGFYEWRRTPAGKQPWLVRFADRRPFAMAGLWEHWRGSTGEALETFTILTTRPNEIVAPIHARMPVILPPEAWDTWLDPSLRDPGPLLDLLGPHPAPGMEAFPVSRRVNDPRNDSPACITPTHPEGET